MGGQKNSSEEEMKAGSLMDAVPRGADGFRHALALQRRAACIGFDWAEPGPVMDKLREEIAEMTAAMAAGDAAQMEDELGDLLFVVINLARQLGIDPAGALRRANAKFETRFRALERLAGNRDRLGSMTLDEMEALWQRAKKGEGGIGS